MEIRGKWKQNREGEMKDTQHNTMMTPIISVVDKRSTYMYMYAVHMYMYYKTQ